MSSIFISFFFVKTLSGTERSINGTALYRASSNTQDEFREFIFKAYIESEESLIQEFEKETIVLMIAHITNYYFYFLFYIITKKGRSDTSNTTPVVADSYISDIDGGRESFMLSKRLYNGVNNHKNIESKVIVSYTNVHGRYNSIKTNLKKTIMSVVGKLKIGGSSMQHIIASEIEWNYAGNNSQSSNVSDQNSTNMQELESLEARYLQMNASPKKKRKISRCRD
ncbi:8877_t:CDS:2 [Acaulospora morrowiae]|uniref:8877_t:CDS:1 n=1 Tax=Acaulospora morrowiae TaxID=94023 RepID=A0A9N9EE96_9GLOM|nr:8877_t:CDS:2 [Acaulospora morrowiae]